MAALPSGSLRPTFYIHMSGQKVLYFATGPIGFLAELFIMHLGLYGTGGTWFSAELLAM